MTENNQAIPNWRYFAMVMPLSYLPWFFITPFFITWMRYLTSGSAAIQDRPRWALGRTEWRFIWGVVKATLMYIASLILIYVIIGIGAFTVTLVGGLIGAALPEGAKVIFGILAAILIFVGMLAFLALYVWLIGLAFRGMAAFVPLAHGEPLNIGHALKATKGNAWRLGGIMVILLIGVYLPIWIPSFAVMPGTAAPVSQEMMQSWLTFQLLMPVFSLPLLVIFGLITCGVYVDFWQQHVQHQAILSDAQTPLEPSPNEQAPV